MGGYNLVVSLAEQGIKYFEYYNISGSSQPYNDNDIIINVTGEMRGVNLWKIATPWKLFNEVFILRKIQDKYYIINYILKTF